MLESLKEQVWKANLDLVKEGLVIKTFGNASGIDRSSGCFVIKPSGVNYEVLKPSDMVVVSLETGKVVEGKYRPSSDTPTHRELYLAFSEIGGVVHTHSLFATAWAQAEQEIPVLGTTHADYAYGAIPCTRQMKPEEIQSNYEANTGKVIVERFNGLNPLDYPGVLVASHGPFTWGKDCESAVEAAVIIEFLAKLAIETLNLNPSKNGISKPLLEKHFFRKHGPNAYYGQKQ
jgi:L-ribulose-5-phosphate 4-epimerase